MEKKKIILLILPLLVVSVLSVFAFSFSGSPTFPSNGVAYNSDVCITTTGDFEGRTSPLGENEIVQCEHNLVTTEGLNAIRDQLSGQAEFGAFNIIGLCNASNDGSGCGPAAAGTTGATFENEFTTSGLNRQSGSYGSLGTGNWSYFKTFSAGSDNLLTNKTGIFNQTTVAGSSILAENTFTLVTLQTNDQLTVNWTIMVTNP